MADHPVPQDVEADDKLIGPFGLRQFIYLMIVGGLVILAVFLWQIFPLLIIIPAPFAIFLLLMALPLKKEQPMETYLAALFHFYFHSHNRWWAPGQRESTVLIEAPKQEEDLTPTINPEEASNRLSYLANVIDTEGGIVNNNMNSAFLADAADTQDMFDTADRSGNLTSMLAKEDQQRRDNIQQIMQGTPPAATTPAPATITVPVNIPAPEPPAPKHELTTAEILSGGHAISSGDLINDTSNNSPTTPTPPPITETPPPTNIEVTTAPTPAPEPTPPPSPKTVDPDIIKAEALPEPPPSQPTPPAEPKITAEPDQTDNSTPPTQKGQKSDGEVYISLH